ncbi:MAG: hypothetical protein AAF600_20655 [Bacteroidota bacterium]
MLKEVSFEVDNVMLSALKLVRSPKKKSVNLHSKNIGIVFDISRQLAVERGQTIIAVTHDDAFAAKSDRVLELSDGQML